MKHYVVQYNPLVATQSIKLVPVLADNLEHAVRLADNEMRTRRKFDVNEFSTKLISNGQGN